MKFTLQVCTSWGSWHDSSYNVRMPKTTELSELVAWLASSPILDIERLYNINRRYRIRVDGLLLTEFDLDNLWILETYV